VNNSSIPIKDSNFDDKPPKETHYAMGVLLVCVCVLSFSFFNYLQGTLHNLMIMGHTNTLKAKVNFTMRINVEHINFQLTQNSLKISVDHINYFPHKSNVGD